MQNAEAAKRLLSSAIGFHKAAEIIEQQSEFQLWPPIYVCIYYAIEQALKAFLTSRGKAQNQLTKIGHRLHLLVEECKQLGMTFPNERFLEFLNQIDGKLTEIRYLTGDDIEVAEASEALQLSWQHIISVCAHIPYDKLPGWAD